MAREEDLLPPELLDELGDLEWAARLVVRGLGPGLHRSKLVGRGEDFDRHRPYQQGDDLRHLDWKLLARTDRLYVQRFRESSHLRAMMVVDASPSMDFGGAGITKLRYAVLLAAALGHILREAGDRPGLTLGGGPGGGMGRFLHPRAGREPWRAYLHALSEAEAGEKGSLAPILEEVGDRLPAGGRIVILSDFLEEDDGHGLVRSAGLLRARGDEVTAVRILTPEELGERGGEDALYTDPEDPERRVPGAPGRDRAYRLRMEAYYRQLARALEERGVHWQAVHTAQRLVPVLRRWLRIGSSRDGSLTPPEETGTP